MVKNKMVARKDIEDLKETSKTSKYPITLHISEGNKLLRLTQYEKAISCFNAGLKERPNNVRCLLGKAKCLMRLLKYDEAKIIAAEIIKLQPKCAEAYTLLADTEFTKGDFEKSNIVFISGCRKRPHSLELRLGHQMCKKAIDNSLKSDTPLILDHIDVKELGNVLKNRSKRQNTKISRNLNRRQMYGKDLKFIKSLLNDEDFSSVSPLCQDLVKYMKERNDFWKMHNPCLKKTIDKKEHDKLSTQKLLDNVSNKCSEAERCFLNGDIETCKHICLETIGLLEKPFYNSTSEGLKIKADILHFLGLAYMLEDDSSSALEYHEQQLKIAEDSNMHDLKKRSFYDIGEDLLKFGDFELALELFRQCLNFATPRSEEAIVLYKIADCELCLENLEDAANHGRQSLSIASFYKDDRLQCDATMLLAEIAVREKNMNEARNLYAEALEIAEESEDSRLDKIKDLIDMFYETLNDHSREESILSFASVLEETRGSLRRLIDINSIQSGKKYNSDYLDVPSHVKAESQNGTEWLEVDSSSCRSSLRRLIELGSLRNSEKSNSGDSNTFLDKDSEEPSSSDWLEKDDSSYKSNDKSKNLNNIA